MDTGSSKITEANGAEVSGDYDQIVTSEWGLDWSDVSQIREKLAMTPTERLQAAQDFMNIVIRIRAQNSG